MKPVKATLFVLAFSLAVVSCTKDKHAVPSVSLKTSDGYTAADATVDASSLVTFGFVADKTEEDLKTFTVSATFDGESKVYNVGTFAVGSDQATHYERDFTIKAHPTAITEKWILTITDGAGKTAQKSVTLTVK